MFSCFCPRSTKDAPLRNARLAHIWCWNEHRHQALIWTVGGLGWGLVCWSYVVWRSTDTWDLAKVLERGVAFIGNLQFCNMIELRASNLHSRTC